MAFMIVDMAFMVVTFVVMAFMLVTGCSFSRVGLQIAFDSVSRTQRVPFQARSAPLEKLPLPRFHDRERSLKPPEGPWE